MLATALSVAVPAVGMPSTARASTPGLPLLMAKKKDAVTPEDANAKRLPVQQRARGIVETDPVAAGVELDNGAAEWGDPVLFMDAAEAYLAAAENDRDEEVAAAAIERARIALDILHFHLDQSADPDFRLVEASDVPGMISRAEGIIDRAQTEIEEIQREAEVAAAPPPPPADKKKRKPSGPKVKIISGAALATVGGGLVAMGAAGLILGAVRQNEAEDPTVYGEAYDSVEEKGKQANLLAGVGLGVGGAVLVVGVALIVVGKRQQKKEGKGDDKLVRVSPTMGPRGGGLSLTGRF